MYSLTIKKHITVFGTYTEDEMNVFDRLEKEWKDSLPHFSQHQLIQIFPEALDYVKEKIRNISIAREHDRNIINKAHFSKQVELIESHNLFYEDRINFYKKFLPIKITTTGFTDNDIRRAKDVLITDYIKVNKGGFTTCPLHTDKTPSLKVYKTNDWYCFSCHEGGDVIDFIQKTQGCDFLSAVKFLIK